MTDKANDFQALTPEQQALLDRDKINESLGPFDFMPGLGTALGAGAGGLFLPAILRDTPWAIRNYGWGHGLKDAALGTGFMISAPAGLGYLIDLKNRALDRKAREEEMMYGNPADAEGQPGGFYGGGRLPTLANLLKDGR